MLVIYIEGFRVKGKLGIEEDSLDCKIIWFSCFKISCVKGF